MNKFSTMDPNVRISLPQANVGSPLLRTSIKEAASKPPATPTVMSIKNRMTPKID